jgi:hypothetical protein
VARLAPFRVKLWDIDASDRGRGSQVAFIDDAKDVGVSAYANEGGEAFFTLPMTHPAIDEISPWRRHYEVSRLDIDTGTYSAMGVGLIDDYDATEDEVIVYGRDYLSLFDLSISAAQQSYTNTSFSSIIQDELSLAINVGDFLSAGEGPAKFISLGSISSVSETTTVLTSYQSRLEFVRQLCEILASDDSTKPIVRVSRTSPFTVTFQGNVDNDRVNVLLEYGGAVNGFRFSPGFSDFATYGYAIGQKREGANLLFSRQTYANVDTYGIIQRSTVFLDVVDQTALDRKTKRFARDLGTTNKYLSLRIGSGRIKPVTGWDIGDSLPVKIDRGLVNIDSLYTCWGWEWTGRKDGSEDLFLDLLPKQT